MKEGWKWGEKKEISEDLGPSFNNLADLFDYELSEELKRLDNYFKNTETKKQLRQRLVDLIRRR